MNTPKVGRSKAAKLPRECRYYGKLCPHVTIEDTWLEAEEFCYSSSDGSAMNRRALVRFPDGSLRIVRCAIPDTYFSIPARARIANKSIEGFITSDESGFKFNEYRK